MYYVIRNKETDEFIDLDKPSGGYPYKTIFRNAHFYTNPDTAKSDLKWVKKHINEDFEIYELIPTFTKI